MSPKRQSAKKEATVPKVAGATSIAAALTVKQPITGKGRLFYFFRDLDL